MPPGETIECIVLNQRYLARYRYSFISKSASIVPHASTVRKAPPRQIFLHLKFRRKHSPEATVCLRSVMVSGDSEERLAASGPHARAPSTTSPPLQLGRFRVLRQRRNGLPLLHKGPSTTSMAHILYGAEALTIMASRTTMAATQTLRVSGVTWSRPHRPHAALDATQGPILIAGLGFFLGESHKKMKKPDPFGNALLLMAKDPVRLGRLSLIMPQ